MVNQSKETNQEIKAVGTEDRLSFSFINQEILEKIQSEAKLSVEAVTLRSEEESLALLMTLEADFVLVLGVGHPIDTVKAMMTFLKSKSGSISLLCFKFLE